MLSPKRPASTRFSTVRITRAIQVVQPFSPRSAMPIFKSMVFSFSVSISTGSGLAGSVSGTVGIVTGRVSITGTEGGQSDPGTGSCALQAVKSVRRRNSKKKTDCFMKSPQIDELW